MPHNLTDLAHIALTGEFSDEVIESFEKAIDIYVKESLSYRTGVLLPLVLRWFIVSYFGITGKQARFYLGNGGKRKKYAVCGVFKASSRFVSVQSLGDWVIQYKIKSKLS